MSRSCRCQRHRTMQKLCSSPNLWITWHLTCGVVYFFCVHLSDVIKHLFDVINDLDGHIFRHRKNIADIIGIINLPLMQLSSAEIVIKFVGQISELAV
ncbi:hypothetical protein RsoM2USA_460 [Ralstonia phage RsoM2USA]|nr:hypothetical protein RsoM2USA_460 [Ralstonia phage RsoM2USA]